MGEIQRSGTEALAALLTRAREDAGLTRRELSERTGLSYPYVSQLETGYRGPSADAMQRLTEVLGVPVDAMVAAMTERNLPRSRTSKPGPTSRPRVREARWLANPDWVPPDYLAGAPPSPGIAPRLSAPAPLTPGESFVTHELLADAAPPPPSDGGDVVAEIVARLGELPPDERMAALAEIQNTVVRMVVADTAGQSDDPSET